MLGLVVLKLAHVGAPVLKPCRGRAEQASQAVFYASSALPLRVVFVRHLRLPGSARVCVNAQIFKLLFCSTRHVINCNCFRPLFSSVGEAEMGTMKGQGLMWKDLKIQQVEAYMALKSSQDRLSFLRQHAKDGLPADQDRADIVLDLYYYALQFGMQQAFTADKVLHH